MSGSCAMYERQENCIQIFGGGTERKRQIGRTGHGMESNIKMDLQETE